MTARSRGFGGHLWSWAQAIVVVYLVVFALVLLGAAITLPLSWLAGLVR